MSGDTDEATHFGSDDHGRTLFVPPIGVEKKIQANRLLENQQPDQAQQEENRQNGEEFLLLVRQLEQHL